MTFSNWMTSRLDRGLSGETLSRRAARFRCSKLVSTIGSGRSSAAVTAAPTDQLLCSASAIPVSLRSSGRALGAPGLFFEQRDSGRHSPELFHLVLDNLCGRLLANERVGATETIPEVV